MRLDLDLVRRVEHSAAEVGARQALALATRSPSSGAAAEPCDGGSLLSFGHGRYVNRAVGLGLGGTDAAEIIAALDRFYDSRSMPPSVEISPWATEDLLGELASADYRLERFRNVYVRALASLPEEPEVSIVRIDAVLHHRIGATGTDDVAEGEVLGTWRRHRRERLGDGRDQGAITVVPDVDRQGEGVRPAGQDTRAGLGHDVHLGGGAGGGVGHRPTEAPAGFPIEQDPGLVCGRRRAQAGGGDVLGGQATVGHQRRQLDSPQPGRAVRRHDSKKPGPWGPGSSRTPGVPWITSACGCRSAC